jgi:hypothetical protein
MVITNEVFVLGMWNLVWTETETYLQHIMYKMGFGSQKLQVNNYKPEKDK